MPGPQYLNGADTCREFVTPALKAADWTSEPHSIAEQYTFAAGRILIYGSTARRGKQRRADYLLRFRRDLQLAAVEAKAADRPAAEGLRAGSGAFFCLLHERLPDCGVRLSARDGAYCCPFCCVVLLSAHRC